MVEFSFDRDEFRPDPSDRREQSRAREERERRMDEQRRESAFFDQQRRDMEQDAREEAVRRVVNDPDIVIDPVLLEIINDPEMTMDRAMRVTRRSMRPMTGRQVIRSSGQFANLALGVDVPSAKKKRKKTKTDKLMSKALREANARLRTKKGLLRKGKTQGDIMRLAHRIRRKMS